MAVGLPAAVLAQSGLPSADELAATDDFSALDTAAEPATPRAQAQPAPAAPSEARNEDRTVQADDAPRLATPGQSQEGSRGFHGISSARPGAQNSFGIGFLGEIYAGEGAVRATDSNNTLVGNLVVQGTFHEHFSANFRLQARNSVNTYGRPQAMLSQGDMLLGLRGHLVATPWLDLAADLSFDLPSSFGSVGPTFSAMSVRPRMLATADLGELFGAVNGEPIPLYGHFNFGYRFDNSEKLFEGVSNPTRIERFAYGINAYDMLEIGLGFEYQLPYVTPFLAWNLNIPVNGADGLCDRDRPLDCVADAGAGSYPQVLSLGLRGEPVKHLGLQAGIDFGLTSKDAEGLGVTLPFNFILGLTYTIDPVAELVVEEKIVEQVIEKAPPQGILVGLVTDRVTGKPVGGAQIEYLTRAENIQLTGATSGAFRSYAFGPGIVLEVMVTHPNYETATMTHIVVDGEQPIEFKLKAAARAGTVRGTVTDINGAAVANATIKLNGAKPVEVKTGADGRYSAEVQAGPYTVAAMASTYQTAGKDVRVEANGTVDLDITLQPAAKESFVEVSTEEIKITDRIQFETGAATILPGSFNVLDQVASVIFENPQIKKMQIQGHTDDVGSAELNLELSQQRADAVRTYLIGKGVAAERLTAKGVGSQQPLLPNTTNRNRSLNRRVEFRIVN
ncbi:MAG: OmpA family protein [Bradymonadaceae bacterium]|nr:OmpA family protein [Lujinxingiaceae bacterium]